jgi:hypothetical protein
MNMYVACSRVVLVVMSLAMGACGAGESDSKGKFAAGLTLSDEAVAGDAGLPAYPGAKPYKDEDDSNAAANLELSTPVFGVKVVAMDLETGDEPERVARFYREALSKYGNVLECRDGADDSKQSAANGNELACESDDRDIDSVVYKVGTEQNQRIVAIKPHGGGTRFSLVHLDVRGESNGKL